MKALKQLSDNCPETVELHRPFIDESYHPLPALRQRVHRVPEVIDCWFDSGAMPFLRTPLPV